MYPLQDLVNLARLIRPPTLVLTERANLQDMARDLRILKGKAVVRTHQEALQLTEQETIVAKTQGSAVALFANTMVKIAQRHLLPHTVRRTNKSLDYQGQPLGAQLPQHTVLHVSVPVTDSEVNESYRVVSETLDAKVFDTNTLGVRDRRRYILASY